MKLVQMSREESYKPISHLYWGKFAYKIETTNPFDNLGIKSFETLSDRCRAFKAKCYRHLPAKTKDWKTTKKWNSPHFYFKFKSDADHFLKNNHKRIRVAYALRQDIDPAVFVTLSGPLRATLYFQRYRHCVEFKEMDLLVKAELDNWVDEIFGESLEVSRYTPRGVRKLYLKDENDILLVRLAFSNLISKIQTITLRSEIIDGRISS